jgi:hypothetical protein
MAACVPLGLVVGLASRRAVPTLPSLPPGLVGDVGEPVGSVRRWTARVGDVALELAAWGVGSERFVEIAPEADLERPDVLVYLTLGGAATGERVPEDALLLGTLAGATTRRFALPPAAADGGKLLFYSLAHQRALGVADLPES